MTEINLAELFKFDSPANLNYKDPIIVIDDQQDLRLIVTHHLQKMTYSNIIHASSAMDALKMLKDQTKPVTILCDQEMPHMSGIELLSEIRENPSIPRGPFCLMMDQVNKEKVMLAVESGVEEMLVKPFTQGDIAPKLRNAYKVFNNPKNPERVYELAKSLLREKKLDESMKVYTILCQAAPKAARPSVGLARVAIEKKDFTQALKFLDEAEQKNSSYVHAYSVRADLLVKMQKWDEAVASYGKAIALSPLNPLRYIAASEVLFKVKRYSEAVSLLKLAVGHGLHFTALDHYMSQALFMLKDYAGSLKHVRTALSHEPENITYLNQYGICLKETGDLEEAQKTYNKVLKLDPEDTSALYNKAVMFNAKGEIQDAIKLLERLLKKHPDFKPGIAKLEEYKKNLAQKGAA